MTECSSSNAGPGDAGVEQKQDGYQVGYGRPPIKHRFKPGNNANPKGRGKKARNRRVVMREVLFELVTVNEGGEVKKMPALEVVLKKVLSQALKGELKAALTVIGMAQREGFLTPEQEEAIDALPQSDLVIVQDAMMRRSETLDLRAGTTTSSDEGGQTNAI